MILRKTFLCLAVLGCSLGSAPLASAALLTFTNPATYAAQVAANSLTALPTINFDAINGVQGNSFSNGGVGFQHSDPLTQLFVHTNANRAVSPQNYLGVNDLGFPEFGSGDTLTLTLPAGTRAVGLNFITDQMIDLVNFGTLTASTGSLNTVAGTGTALPAAGFTSYFLGIIDTTNSFTSATVTSSNGVFFTVDDVAVAAVPEPSSMLLAAAGLAALARRRRSAR